MFFQGTISMVIFGGRGCMTRSISFAQIWYQLELLICWTILLEYLILSRVQSLQNFDTTKLICHQNFQTCQCFWHLIWLKRQLASSKIINMINNNRTPIKIVVVDVNLVKVSGFCFALGHLRCGLSVFSILVLLSKTFLPDMWGTNSTSFFNSHALSLETS